LKTWKEAYDNFDNAGVVIADEDGSALLQVRRPQPYLVPVKGLLEPHIHYRICDKNGMIGSVKSIHLETRNEGFASAIHV
jgi:protocatechuate 3,4-dioxygenase beta subunit